MNRLVAVAFARSHLLSADPTHMTAAATDLLQIKRVLYMPQVLDLDRGREILARFPDAALEEVRSHWNIPGLHGNEGLVEDWVRVKRETLVVGILKTLQVRPNGRSADFIAPSMSNGCAMACAYCYVPRRKGYANPITVYANIDAVMRTLLGHISRQGMKMTPNQVHPSRWVYDIGENSDVSVDALVSDNVLDVIGRFRDMPTAMVSFATKFVNEALLGYDPQGGTRIRFSLLPHRTSRLLDVRTSPVSERIGAVNAFVDAGFEVHLNFSPVVITDGWLGDYADLFDEINDRLTDRAKAQLACEVIFLTHNEGLHEINLGWHPKAEELLWQPAIQEKKQSENGALNVRYRSGFKGRHVQAFKELIAEKLPYCRVRYAF